MGERYWGDTTHLIEADGPASARMYRTADNLARMAGTPLPRRDLSRRDLGFYISAMESRKRFSAHRHNRVDTRTRPC